MKIASIGFWHLHAKDYANAALANPTTELVAVWDENPTRSKVAAEQFGLRYVEDLQDILTDDSIDGVIVCTATVDHLDIVTRCARAGKHIFVEKVLGTTLADAQAIEQATKDNNVTLMVSLWRSDKGSARQIAAMVASGDIGEVTGARVRDGHPFALRSTDDPDGTLPLSFYNRLEAAGGILIDLCHPLYVLAQIAGYPSSVASAFGHLTSRDVEDNAAVLFEYASGAFAVAETSSVSAISPFSIEVHGTAGSVLYSEPGIGALAAQGRGGPPAYGNGPDDRPRLRLRKTKDSDESWVEIPLESDAPTAFDQWVQHCQDGTRADENLALAVALSGIVEAAYLSAIERRFVDTESLS